MCCWKSNCNSSDLLFLFGGELVLFSWVPKKSLSGRWNTDAVTWFISVRFLFEISLDMCHQSVALGQERHFSEEASGRGWIRWCFCLKDRTGKGEITIWWCSNSSSLWVHKSFSSLLERKWGTDFTMSNSEMIYCVCTSKKKFVFFWSWTCICR